VTDSVLDAREAFRSTELRLRLLLLGDGSETPGYVKGEDPRRRVSAELRHLREAFDALGEEASRATTATAHVADLERELLRVAAERAAPTQQPSPDPEPPDLVVAAPVRANVVDHRLERADRVLDRNGPTP
jgi:hypothetical protein